MDEIEDYAEYAWYEDGEDGPWATGCGHYFSIIDGTPNENKFKYCCFCGSPLREIPPETEEEE